MRAGGTVGALLEETGNTGCSMGHDMASMLQPREHRRKVLPLEAKSGCGGAPDEQGAYKRD